MEILIDVHNHTIASGHAYSTIQEIAAEASRKGLKYVGITDHGPKMIKGPHIYHIRNQRIIPRIINGVEILKGVESNILNQEGKLDVPDEVLEELDIVLAGLHDVCIEPWDVEGNTKALLKVMENENVDIISHPGNPKFPIDKEKFVLKAKETNTLVEINDSSFRTSREGSKENCRDIALLCKKHRVPVIVNSDSHISFDVGRVDKAINLLKDIEMPEELIINACIDRFENHFRDKRKSRFI